MTTTQASKRMRFAALGLSTALSVGTLAPFIGFSSASAATSCTTVSSGYSRASASLAVHEAKLHKAKKKLKKAKRHHASHRVIKHDKKKVHKLHRKVRHDKANRTYWSNQRTNCTTGSAANPTGSANPLTDLVGTLATQLQGAGAPSQLTDALAQLQKQLAGLQPPSGVDPATFQKALTDAANAIQKSLATPPTSAQGLIDAIVGPIVQAFGEFPQASALTSALTQLQTSLDSALSQLPDLGSILGGTGGLPGLPTLPTLG